ncbi:hypothetical protein N9B53_00965 [Mariniblastus sp.]|nr:hypothetical protein [Mariniblastus sp.]
MEVVHKIVIVALCFPFLNIFCPLTEVDAQTTEDARALNDELSKKWLIENPAPRPANLVNKENWRVGRVTIEAQFLTCANTLWPGVEIRGNQLYVYNLGDVQSEMGGLSGRPYKSLQPIEKQLFHGLLQTQGERAIVNKLKSRPNGRFLMDPMPSIQIQTQDGKQISLAISLIKDPSGDLGQARRWGEQHMKVLEESLKFDRLIRKFEQQRF